MKLVKMVDPMHVAREAVGLAGTVTGVAGAVAGKTVGTGRDLLLRVIAPAEPAGGGRQPDVVQPQAGHPETHPTEPSLPGADTVAFPPAPPAEPPVDVVGEALAGGDGPVTEGGAVVEPGVPDDPRRAAD